MLLLWSLLFLSGCCALTIPYGSSLQIQHKRQAAVSNTQFPLVQNGNDRRVQSVLDVESLARNATLDVFQVHKPVRIPEEAKGVHTICLITHSFGNSYGHPYVGRYTPPPRAFTNVHIDMTVRSRGRQFDRLAVLYFGDIEVFRTSTAEPNPSGIVWSHEKDMTPYLSLWQTPQKVIFDLGNLINEVYTGFFNVTLTATFFTIPKVIETADLILPISAHRSSSDSPSAFTIPSDNASSILSVPRNTARAIVSIAACGQATEEFWYGNVPSSLVSTFHKTAGDLGGFSSFREVQLYIDGMLAGFVFPLPVVFTGGIAPGLWRPMVAVDSFDLREFEIDISPFLVMLSDGKPHSFEIRVVGLDDVGLDQPVLSKSVGDYWVVTGKVFLFLDSDASNPPWEPQLPMIQAPPPSVSMKTTLTRSKARDNKTAQNKTLEIEVRVSRDIVISSRSGLWHQFCNYYGYNGLDGEGLNQVTHQSILGDVQAVVDQRNALPVHWGLSFAQSLHVRTNLTIFTHEQGGGIGISAALLQKMRLFMHGRPDGSLLGLTAGNSETQACQMGSAEYSSQPNHSYSFGTTTEHFSEVSGGDHEYRRNVQAVNGSVVKDEKLGEAGWSQTRSATPAVKEVLMKNGHVEDEERMLLDNNARAMIGRGPGSHRGLYP